MRLQKYPIRWSIVIVATVIVGLLFYWETNHLNIETDILESMPQGDPILTSARQVISHLPVQDKIFIDLEQASADRDKLVRAVKLLEGHLNKSGLFTKVGVSDEAGYFPELLLHVNDHLPALLNASDLEQKIQPVLSPEKIREAMAQNRRSLEELTGIGRAEMMVRDPLGFSGVILSRMSALAPANNAQFYNGQLLSADGRHALIIARIAGSGTDTAKAAKIERLLEDCQQELKSNKDLQDQYILTPVGGYRAALDNETIAKRDVKLAVTLTTVLIIILLILIFPRPLIGLLALLPSSVGGIGALFVCSFLFKSMSILSVGFGGAIMAFTVDMGIAYLLFLDQPYTTYGKRVAREVWSAELMATVTTVGAFLLLLISDFKILAEIGVFSALGVAFALLFVHFVFPKVFPWMPPSKRRANRFLRDAIINVAAPAKWKLWAAVCFGLIMLLLAKPVFNVDLQSMNSMSPDSIQAEKKLAQTWGSLSGKSYVLLEAPNTGELQKKNEQLMTLLAFDVQEEKLAPVFLPSVLFPSRQSAQSNFNAWQNFWTPDRLKTLKRDFNAAARENGFKPEAFAPFWKTFHHHDPGDFTIPEKYFEMLGIAKNPEGFTQVSLLAAGKHYDANDLFGRISAAGFIKFFDADLFNKRLSGFLKNLFLEIALIISVGLILITFLHFLDWRLSLAALAPVAFALCATLGTMKLIGHPLDIPGIMLWIIVMGMGDDYAIYYICHYQRNFNEKLPAMHTIKFSMFLSACTTLIGFGVLIFANHAVLKSIGIVSFLGIGYALIGAFFILPYLMEKIYAPVQYPTGAFPVSSGEHLRRALLRFRHLPAYPRVFARFKIMMDPMFKELEQYVKNPRRIIDIGCGYGIPSTWLLEIYPQAKIFGLDPDEERVLIASRVIGERGRVEVGRAPDLPAVEGRVDYVLMLDMIHLISDEEAKLALRRVYEKLEADGTLLIRATVPSERKFPWKRWIEVLRLRFVRMPERFRAREDLITLIADAGFKVEVFDAAAAKVEEKWFVGRKT